MMVSPFISPTALYITKITMPLNIKAIKIKNKNQMLRLDVLILFDNLSLNIVLKMFLFLGISEAP